MQSEKDEEGGPEALGEIDIDFMSRLIMPR
jgi:hypothetical protein